jgi:hypothetical protein
MCAVTAIHGLLHFADIGAQIAQPVQKEFMVYMM